LFIQFSRSNHIAQGPSLAYDFVEIQEGEYVKVAAPFFRVKLLNTLATSTLSLIVCDTYLVGSSSEIVDQVIDNDKFKVKDSDVKQELQLSNFLTKLKPCFQRGLGNCWNMENNGRLINDGNNITFYIYNPPNSGKQIFVYNIAITAGNRAEDAANVKFGKGSGSFNPDTSREIVNLNTNIVNKTNQNYGRINATPNIVFTNTTDPPLGFYRIRGITDTLILDYQEEHIQLGEGTGFYVHFAVSFTQSTHVGTHLRFMEIPNNDLPTEWVV
jgi:hypothetical protein